MKQLKKFVFAFTFISLSVISFAQDLEHDSLALVDLYNSTDGANWTQSDNWLSGDVSSWYGIEVETNRVTKISLYNNSLKGDIPSTLINISALDTLIINNNQLVNLPNISSLSSIQYFLVDSNKLTFEDIEPNITITGIRYSPQDSVKPKIDTVICEGSSLTMSSWVGGNNNHYQWKKDGTNIGTDDSLYAISNMAISDTGTYTCEVTNTIVTGLTLYRRFVHVQYFANPVVNLGNDTSVCTGKRVRFNAGNGYLNYLWQDGSSASTYTASNAGTYWVRVTNSYGCIGSDTIELSLYPLPIINDLGADTTICRRGEIILHAGKDIYGTFSWKKSSSSTVLSTADSLKVDSNVRAGMFVVTKIDTNGCQAKDSVQVNFMPLPVADLGSDQTMCKPDTLTLSTASSPDYKYFWLPYGDTTESVKVSGLPVGFHQYQVTVMSRCDTTSDAVVITSDLCELEIPNVITPNGDGVNDVFKIPKIESYPNNTLIIYDRWGKKVYEKSGYKDEWGGEKLPDGVYYYVLKITDGLANVAKSGSVTIIGKGL